MNNMQVANGKDLDVVMPVYNLKGYSDSYSKAFRSLWLYYKDDPNATITDSEPFKFKARIIGRTPANGDTKHD